MTDEQKKIPIWFWVVSIILLIWNLMGVANFFLNITFSDEALQAMPQNERELYGKLTSWILIAFALAVFGGAAGSIALLLKKKIAKHMFIGSLIGVIVHAGYSLLIAKSMDVYGSTVVLMTIILIGVGVFAIWFSQYCIAKNWIK